MQMPAIDLKNLEQALTADEFALVKGIVATRGKNKGCLRAAKPKVAKMVRVPAKSPRWQDDYDLEYANQADGDTGKTAYIWRMVVFAVSPMHQHKCVPCTADFSVPGQWGDEKRAILKDLDRIANIVSKSIPLSQHHGTIAWGKALGYF